MTRLSTAIVSLFTALTVTGCAELDGERVLHTTG